MPSGLHELLVHLFRFRPELSAELLRDVLKVELPSYTSIRLDSADRSKLVPTSFHADLVLKLEHDGRPVLGIVLEVQLRIAVRKLLSWPFYGVSVRAELDCPTCVLVVTPDPKVAAWAAQPIVLGPGSVYRPLVLGPDAVPLITDDEQAARAPELAVLSVMAHGMADPNTAAQIARAARRAAVHLETERAVLYYNVIGKHLSAAARAALEEIMDPRDFEYDTEFSRKHIAVGRAQGIEEGRAEGRAQGKAEGRAEGRAEGKAEGKAESVLAILRARGLALSDRQQDRVTSCSDLAVLDRWLLAALTVSSVDELFDLQ